jgi:hypothetical protein
VRKQKNGNGRNSSDPPHSLPREWGGVIKIRLGRQHCFIMIMAFLRGPQRRAFSDKPTLSDLMLATVVIIVSIFLIILKIRCPICRLNKSWNGLTLTIKIARKRPSCSDCRVAKAIFI